METQKYDALRRVSVLMPLARSIKLDAERSELGLPRSAW